jgi:hypothetical protein
MARLLVGSQWYEGLSSNAHYEFEFEDLVCQHAGALFPGWHVVPFKTDVVSEVGTHRPDLALVDDSYRCWYVVEIELAHHSLEGHVLPQVETFVRGSYGQPHAEHLKRMNESLDYERLLDMVRGEPPGVLVVVDQPALDWRRPLGRLGVLLAVVEVFRSGLNQTCLRVNGEQPRAPRAALTLLRRHPLLPRTMVVSSPAGLGGVAGDRYAIDLDGKTTSWIRVDTADQVLLQAQKSDPLFSVGWIEVIELPDGRLGFGERGR